LDDNQHNWTFGKRCTDKSYKSVDSPPVFLAAVSPKKRNIKSTARLLCAGKKIRLWLAFLIMLCFSGNLLGQFPGSGRNGGFGNFGNTGSSGSQSSTEKDASRDTLNKEVYYYYADNAEERTLFQDSSKLNFHLYDPVRQAKYEYVNIGNLGSAHRPIVFQPRFRKGFDAGFHNYDLYLTKPEDIRYYNSEKDFSDVYFSQTSQEKTAFGADFSKPISKNSAFGFRYRNIRNTGQYNNQAARTNSFSGTYSYQSKNKKYRSYLNFTTNTVEQRENGGVIISDSLTTLRKSLVAVGRPVNTITGESRYFERDINYTQFYLLQKTPKFKDRTPTTEDSLRALVTQVPTDTVITKIPESNDSISTTEDSLRTLITQAPKDTVLPKTPSPNAGKRPPLAQRGNRTPPSSANSRIVDTAIPATGRKFTLKHNLSLRRNTYKYVDEDSLSYYGDFLLDDRGIRNFIQTDQIENTFSIRTFKLAKDNPNSLYGTNEEIATTQKDLIEVGINHTFTKLNQEPIDSNINNLFLFGKIEFTPSERLNIKTYGHLGTLRQIGDYYLKGDFLWDTKKLGKIEFSLTNQFYTPNLLQRQFYVTSQNAWQNDFNKVFENSLSASYTIPKLKTNVTANYHLIRNYIYYDNTARPKQDSSTLNIFQLILNNQIDVGRFHLQNTVYFQQATADVIRIPQIYSIHPILFTRYRSPLLSNCRCLF